LRAAVRGNVAFRGPGAPVSWPPLAQPLNVGFDATLGANGRTFAEVVELRAASLALAFGSQSHRPDRPHKMHGPWRIRQAFRLPAGFVRLISRRPLLNPIRANARRAM